MPFASPIPAWSPTLHLPGPPARPAAGLPAGEARDEAARLLDEVRLAEAGGVRAGAYSGGMRRRLSVAIALLGDPQASAARPACWP